MTLISQPPFLYDFTRSGRTSLPAQWYEDAHISRMVEDFEKDHPEFSSVSKRQEETASSASRSSIPGGHSGPQNVQRLAGTISPLNLPSPRLPIQSMAHRSEPPIESVAPVSQDQRHRPEPYIDMGGLRPRGNESWDPVTPYGPRRQWIARPEVRGSTVDPTRRPCRRLDHMVDNIVRFDCTVPSPMRSGVSSGYEVHRQRTLSDVPRTFVRTGSVRSHHESDAEGDVNLLYMLDESLNLAAYLGEEEDEEKQHLLQ